MEPDRTTPPPRPPAVRRPTPLAAVPEPEPDATAPPQARSFDWRRFTKSPRTAAGLAIGAAALLLWPFSGWSWIPWLVGLALLVLLRLLRLDGLLRGWALHLGGVAVVVGLTYSTGPSAWALAGSIGVLLAGLLRLPAWKVAAVGAVLCVISGVGFGIASYRDAQQAAADDAQSQLQSRGQQGANRPAAVLPIMLNRIAQNIPGPICDNFLADSARSAFVSSTGQSDCVTAVASIAARVADRDGYAGARAPFTATPTGAIVDACAMTWIDGKQVGPQLGALTIGRKEGGTTYVVVGFRACPAAALGFGSMPRSVSGSSL